MQQFVFWTGVYNLIVSSVFLIPGSTNLVGIDLLIGLAYITSLPRALNVPARNLLFDR